MPSLIWSRRKAAWLIATPRRTSWPEPSNSCSGRRQIPPAQPGKDGRPKGVPVERVGWVNGQPQGEWLGYVNAAAKAIYVPSSIDADALYAALPADARRLLPRGPSAFWNAPGRPGRCPAW